MKTIAIIQSNYIPWIGYFDIINDVDSFIFLDNVQYTNRDWRNRNYVKTVNGTAWLSIPVGADRNRLICDVKPIDNRWQDKHWKTLSHLYGKAPYFSKYAHFLEDFYLNHNWQSLSELNQYLIQHIAREFLGVDTDFIDSSQYEVKSSNQDRLLDLLQQTGGKQYVSGPSARDYIEENRFKSAGIELIWKDYSNYPEYPQFHPPFEHAVTILDLLFHTGPDASWYIWGWRNQQQPPRPYNPTSSNLNK